ncbi:MAG: beta-ketoacyl synthase N-terminal-like domain-containing protein, partial [Desulfatirhabdiaceae bacterium]
MNIPIAIVGMGCVFPGADTPGRFWENIIQKRNMSAPVPSERWIADRNILVSQIPEPDRTISDRACLIHDFRFDSNGFKVDACFLKQIDPVYHLLLHAAKSAWSACHAEIVDKSRVDVILAAIALPTDAASRLTRNMFEDREQGAEGGRLKTENKGPIDRTTAHSAKVTAFPAVLISQALELGGASFTLDAACASSIYAIKLGCDSLISGSADAVLAGGVSRPDNLYTQIGFSQLRALSPSGICRPFDRDADGLVVGEGAGVLVLKRLDDAIRQGDAIHAVIRGIGISNDMRGNLLAPDTEGQVRAMAAAYAAAGWDPTDVDLIECHGAGTPVGDAVEIASLKALWKNNGAKTHSCPIGSIKSMIGHLLTAAGSAAVIKILLAIGHQTLPPSLNFSQADEKTGLSESPFRVQTVCEKWNHRNPETPRRAAVSAFGFGGINAHLLLEEFHPSKQSLPSCTLPSLLSPALPSCPIAVVGMEAVFGTVDSLSKFQDIIFNGRSIITDRPPNRWKHSCPAFSDFSDLNDLSGGFLDQLILNPGDFKIPPAELSDIIIQHLLMLKVSRDALMDAGLDLRTKKPDTGAIIGMGFDFEATDFQMRWLQKNAHPEFAPPLNTSRTLGALGGIIASRIAREFGFGGPSFTVSGEETSGLLAVETAIRLLRQHEANVMLAGAVDMAGDIRNILIHHAIRPYTKQNWMTPFDPLAEGSLPGEGAAAVVLKRLDQALEDGNRIYAIIRGMGNASATAMSTNDHNDRRACGDAISRCLKESGISAQSISLIETHGSGDPVEDRLEAQALSDVFLNTSGFRALGSVKPNIGHAGAAAGMASFVKACLCLYHEILPPMVYAPQSVWPEMASNGFHIPHAPQYWARNREDGPRSALVSAMTGDGAFSHVVLEGHESTLSAQTLSERKRPLGYEPYGLFVIAGNSPSDLITGLDRLKHHIQDANRSLSMEHAARIWFATSRQIHEPDRVVCIVAESAHQLIQSIAEAISAVENGIARRIAGPCRVAYSPDPIERCGKTALVYPGSGNHYPGMGQKISMIWPDILTGWDAASQTLQKQLIAEHLTPWKVAWPDGWQQQTMKDLANNPVHAIFAQVMVGCIMTRVLSKFDIQPDAVIGYSLGESAGLFATGAWSDRDAMRQRMQRTELFTRDLAGPCTALRNAWNIKSDDPFKWAVAVVHHASEMVRHTLQQWPNVRLLIINTPEECVIGGNRPSIEAVIRHLKCEAIYLDGVVTVHCDAAAPVEAKYRDLHLFPTTPPDGIHYYSCHSARSYPVTRESAADSITAQAISGFDFPAVIHQAWQDGVRIFLEMGPHSTCTRMIDQILSDRPHLALSASFRGEDEYLSLLKFLGNLIAERIPVSLDALYGDAAWPSPLPGPMVQKTDRQVVRVAGAWPGAGERKTEDRERKSDVRRKEGEKSRRAEKANRPSNHLIIQSGIRPMDHPVIQSLIDVSEAVSDAHKQFLDISVQTSRSIADAVRLQCHLLNLKAGQSVDSAPSISMNAPARPIAFAREQCMEFAVGSAAAVLGPDFADVDTYPVRVRLPDEPLMLVDRILSIEGARGSLGKGRIVTEHVVLPGAWYLDGGKAPVCISVEAGQADLFLCAWMGIDLVVKGKRAYRLLDARVTFHRGLPVPGETIRYDIHINRFVRQGDTWMFFFNFTGEINGVPLITMTNGCAGFFTEDEIENSGGIILAESDPRPESPYSVPDRYTLFPMMVESYDDAQLDALRQGNLESCFGNCFSGICLSENLRLPGDRMHLIDRVTQVDPTGGKYGFGYIRAEADIHADDWFLTCHFLDDPVMPGTLMYECCSHALRVFLLRMGWFSNRPDVYYEPVLGVVSVLKCRGPVTPKTGRVIYEVDISEIGFNPEPYVIADALMVADGRTIVHFSGMSMKLSGITEEDLRFEISNLKLP